MISEFAQQHTFQTTVGLAQFSALVTKSCRGRFEIELIGTDLSIVPPVTLVTVGFSSPEDQDRVRIALRMAEKEMNEGAARPGSASLTRSERRRNA